VHHVKHKADGGPTSLTGCVLLCAYHHQVMIHRRGWTLIVNPDGTTTAWNKDKTKGFAVRFRGTRGFALVRDRFPGHRRNPGAREVGERPP